MKQEIKKSKNKLQARPPVVVVLGHVDHGKSSIIEAIKDLKITEKESGGITQHIAAYEVNHHGKQITFIDTPGHEAFDAMRSRGAKVADIAILVVAADEGVKAQTKEVIKHIKEAKIPLIVALNKIDKTNSDQERVKRELAGLDVLVESMGGKVPAIETSATEKKGVAELLDMILIVAELEELTADPAGIGQGVIIESHLDSQRGPTTTLLVTKGTLNKSDVIATNSSTGKIRIMENFQGAKIAKAGPSTPVILIGFEYLPQVGETFNVFESVEKARGSLNKKQKTPSSQASMENSDQSEKKGTLNIIIKADVLGSLEAITAIIKKLEQDKVEVQVLRAEVGEINESDVKIAGGARAQIIGFRTKTDSIAGPLANRDKVKIKIFEVIYDLGQYLEKEIIKTIKTEIVRVDIGKMKALVIFRTEKNRQIVGGKMIEGEVKKGLKLEVLRGKEVIGKGRMVGLQKNKKDIESAKKGEEIGILFESDTKISENDIIVFYARQQKQDDGENSKS